MKKFVVFILTVMCIVSIPMNVTANELYDQNEEQYCLNFNIETQSDLEIIYSSDTELTFDVPVEFTVMKNTPISVNYVFVCWKDKATGELYFPGDKIIVDGNVSLEAVWNEIDNNYPDFLNILIAKLKAVIRNISDMLGLYDVSKNVVPATKNNCKLIVNGKDITERVYVMIDYNTKTVSIPFLTVVEELGADVNWKNRDIVTVTYNGISQDLDAGDPSFGISSPPGCEPDDFVRMRVKDDLIFDLTSVNGAFKLTFNASVTVNYDESVIIIEQVK